MVDFNTLFTTPQQPTPQYGDALSAAFAPKPKTPQEIEWGKIQTDLFGAGYTGKFVHPKEYGQWGTQGMDVYTQALEYGKTTGDWAPMQQFQEQAEYGKRKYHRGGLFQTGLSISPLGVFGLGVGAFTAAGGFGNLGGLLGGKPATPPATTSGTSVLNAATQGANVTGSGGLGGFAQGTAGGLGGTATGGLTSAGTAATTAASSGGSIITKVKDFLSSPAGTATSAATNLKSIIGGLVDLKTAGNAQSGLDALTGSTGPSQQTLNAYEDLDNAIHGVDRDAYIKEQMRQYTANASAQHGVDSGAYIEGLQRVIGDSILELAQFQADSSYKLGSLSSGNDQNTFQNKANILNSQFSLDQYRNYNMAQLASTAFDFIFK